MTASLDPQVGQLPRRLAMLSLHTSPLAQPGTGDAGGMNVYVAQTARRLPHRGVEVEIFTRATGSDQPPVERPWPGVTVRHVVAGPFQGLDKDDLPGQMCAFSAGVLHTEANHRPGFYDLVHSHYWLSGQVGYLVRDRWAVPLVHSAHTLAKVKNAALVGGGQPEPRGRVIGEEQVIAEADRLIANTDIEARQLIELYGADPALIDVVTPGVDLDAFTPGGPTARAAARATFGIEPDEVLLVFAGRIQPLKAPDVLVRAVALLAGRYPGRRFRVILAGGNSGPGRSESDTDLLALAAALGIGDNLALIDPLPPDRLAELFRAADAVAVPSHSESFGLVALEAQAVGTPVVAAAVGGLTVAVADGVSGLLVPGHGTRQWADAMASVVLDPGRRKALSNAAPRHAARYSWDATVDGLLASYTSAAHARGDRPSGRRAGLIAEGSPDVRTEQATGVPR